jgi:ribonuclease HII
LTAHNSSRIESGFIRGISHQFRWRANLRQFPTILFAPHAVFGPKSDAVAKRISRRFRYETKLLEKGVSRIAGVEALAPATREILFAELTSRPEIQFGIAQVDAPLIDQINILQASHRAMNMALAKLQPAPEHVLVDGLPVRSMQLPQTAIVSGDALSYSIAAASILAKVSRDRLMVELDGVYPGYGFAVHKGYGTPGHLAALEALGACALHRQSFAPCQPSAQGELFESP